MTNNFFPRSRNKNPMINNNEYRKINNSPLSGKKVTIPLTRGQRRYRTPSHSFIHPSLGSKTKKKKTHPRKRYHTYTHTYQLPFTSLREDTDREAGKSERGLIGHCLRSARPRLRRIAALAVTLRLRARTHKRAIRYAMAI